MEAQNLNEYQYLDLESARDFRLINLLPGTGDICFTIVPASLDAEPVYEALSYAWGNCIQDVSVCCNGSILRVTQILSVALRHLRHPEQHRILWIDAICINQANVAERNLQVRVMRLIYAGSSQVLVWLGTETTADVAAFQLINTFGGVSDASYTWQDREFTAGEFLKRPWFRRVWVIQEVALASKALVLCGSLSTGWDSMLNMFQTIRANGFEAFFGTTVFVMAAATLMLSLRRVDAESKNSERMLLRLLETTQPFSSTEPADRVFALLSLATDGNDCGVTPDYSLKCEAVYKNLTMYHLLKKRELRILSFSSGANQTSTLTLPTWVPDWSNNANIAPISPLFGNNFTASGNTSLDLSIHDAENILFLSGLIVDVVHTVATGSLTFDQSDIVTDHAEIQAGAYRTGQAFIECEEMASVAQPYPTGEDLSDIFWRIIICDRSESGQQPQSDFLEASRVLRYLLGLYNSCDPSTPVEIALKDYDVEKYPMTPTVLQYIASVGKWSSGRVFATTKNRRLGWVRKGVEPGDLVCIVHGGEVPYMLRPRPEGGFQLLGDCYFYGIMNGEAMTMEGLDEVKFAIH